MMASTLGVTYAAAATAGTVAESKKPTAADIVPMADEIKHSNAKENHVNDISEKLNSDDVKINYDDSSKRVEGSADGKAVKQDKSTAGTGKQGKSGDREVFVPAPPPATNAWAKRLQNQSSATSVVQIQPAAVMQSSNTVSIRDNKQQEKAATKVEPSKPAVSNSLAADADIPQSRPVGVSRSVAPSEIASKTEEELAVPKSAKSSNKFNSAVSDGGHQKLDVTEQANVTELKLKQDSGEMASSVSEVKAVHDETNNETTGGRTRAEASAAPKSKDALFNTGEKTIKSPEGIQVSEKPLSPLEGVYHDIDCYFVESM